MALIAALKMVKPVSVEALARPAWKVVMHCACTTQVCCIRRYNHAAVKGLHCHLHASTARRSWRRFGCRNTPTTSQSRSNAASRLELSGRIKSAIETWKGQPTPLSNVI